MLGFWRWIGKKIMEKLSFLVFSGIFKKILEFIIVVIIIPVFLSITSDPNLILLAIPNYILMAIYEVYYLPSIKKEGNDVG